MNALDGLRIVDLTTMISGPYGSMLLADMGAEVIKVEPPGGGDASRTLQKDDPDYHYQGMSSYFLTLGRNKRSIVLDLHAEAGRLVLHDLVRSADRFVSVISQPPRSGRSCPSPLFHPCPALL